MGIALRAVLNQYPLASHFVGHRAGGTGPGVGIQDPVAGPGGHADNPLEQRFRFLALDEGHASFLPQAGGFDVGPKVARMKGQIVIGK